ncbi:LOW QUALITY PROTEIN: FYN-binding protein 1 [Notolabrus celidotus]|uniref:LOW QUALITY PROTEIN: FYN-binding protein 1 n=1 Tax=Notolabrus celidotus TaxID=1203425 RepID=UPI00148FEDA0|nr:LOW QUALITY PROTEIN: FYN-binding protein 1 [Notolabrus celidotus]
MSSQNKKGDVKAMMARFQAGGASTDETSSPAVGRPKQPLHPTVSSGPTIQAKKPVLESLSGSAINTPPKPPSFLKNTVSTKSDTDVHEPNRAKALASRFGGPQDDTNTNSKPFVGNKQQVPYKLPLSQATENKPPIQKPPFNKPPLSHTLSDTKPTFPKPSLAVGSKPSWIKEDSGGSVTSSPPPKLPLQQKPSSSIGKLRQHNEEIAGSNADTNLQNKPANKPAPVPSPAIKPTSNFRNAQNMFNKEKEKAESSDGDVKSDGAKKPPLAATISAPPPKPPANKKPSIRRPPQTRTQIGKVNSDATAGPKRNPLPNSLALGPAPAKPNRPPKVNLENFKRGAEASDDGPGTFKKPLIPTPPTSHPSNNINHVTPTQPPQQALPSLPPRHPGTMPQQEDFYDDVDEFSSPPPPLPPSTGHPSQKGQVESDDDDGEMYEDLDERWDLADQKQDKINEKEEKKRLEAERKEQKEREKKEQDARKKFKLVGPLEAVHQGKACVDCRGSKTDLALKQGDSLDIIRVQGNPEGKWLGRTQDGSIGYVKTTSVEIDFNSLKNHKAQQAYDPEVYDDIDVAMADNSGIKGPGVVLPPLPGEEGEIYDDVVDLNLEVSPLDLRSSFTKPRGFLRMFERSRRQVSTKVVPPPSQFTAEGNSDQTEAIDEEIYDDVDSQNVPPLPPISSLPTLKSKGKTEEMDSKKQKKFEKEEKDFRKKFKYDGEVQVLYQVNVIPSLNNKKWGSKDLQVKAGEKLDVIAKAVDNKLICRNEDGKFGYVSTSHIDMDDGDIYDDIGDDCIYDND